MRRIAFICMAAILMTLPAAVMAQQRSGQIKGRVADTAGKPVSNLIFVVRNTATGIEHETKTDQSGEFLIAGLEPGKYAVKNPGAVNPQAKDITVDPESTTHLNMKQDGSGVLTIAAESIATDMTTAPIRTVFSPTLVELLSQPNAISRTGDYFGAYNLSLFSEGVTPGYALQTGVGPAVGGRPNTSNNFMVDGTDNNDHIVPGPLVTVSNEATNEFALMQGQHTPALGHSSGGKMQSILSSGGNAWHGGAYDYLNNRTLNATEAAFGGSTRDLRYDQNRMGGKIGGPLMKNTLFGFFNFEYVPLRSEQTSLNRVLAPTATGLNLLSFNPGVSAINLNVLRNNLQVSDTPVSFTTVNGFSIPLGEVNTFYKTSQNRYEGVARLDWTLAGNSNLAAKYVHNDIGTDTFGSALEAFKVPGHTRALLGALTYTTVFSTTLTANVNAGYNRLDRNSGAPSVVFPGQSAFPNINIQNVGLALGSNVGIGRAVVNTYQGAATVDLTMPNHNFVFGGDWRDINSSIGKFGSASGTFAYTTLDRFLLDLPPDVVAQRSFGDANYNGNQNLLYLFGQDKMRFGGVDVELGLAYQYAQVPASIRRQSRFSSLNVPGLIDFDEPKSDTLNLAPRIGLAWSDTRTQTVFRGSFGMMYDALNQFNAAASPELRFGSVNSSLLNFPGFFASGGVTEPVTIAGGIGSVALEQRLPYIVNWTVAASHGFWGRLATEFKYMGNHGVHQPLQTILNGSRVTVDNSLPVFFTTPDQATLNALTTTQRTLAASFDGFTAAGFTNPILTTRPDGTSWYNAASVKLAETFTAGTQITGQYTWSDVKTDSTGTLEDVIFGRRQEQAPWNVKHRATITSLFDIASMLPQASGIVKNIIADLSITGTLQYNSSPRVALFSGLDTGMDGNGFGSGVFVNPLGTPGIGSGVTPLTNTSGQIVAFRATNPNAQFVTGGIGTFSLDRPTIGLDDTRNVDMAIVKRFTAPDTVKVEFRADAFNVFNRAQFTGIPVSTLATGIAPGAKQNFLLANNPQFNNIRGALSSNPRTVQLAVRLIF